MPHFNYTLTLSALYSFIYSGVFFFVFFFFFNSKVLHGPFCCLIFFLNLWSLMKNMPGTGSDVKNIRVLVFIACVVWWMR